MLEALVAFILAKIPNILFHTCSLIPQTLYLYNSTKKHILTDKQRLNNYVPYNIVAINQYAKGNIKSMVLQIIPNSVTIFLFLLKPINPNVKPAKLTTGDINTGKPCILGVSTI